MFKDDWPMTIVSVTQLVVARCTAEFYVVGLNPPNTCFFGTFHENISQPRDSYFGHVYQVKPKPMVNNGYTRH